MDLATIAAELYAKPLDEFTAARNERAKEIDDKDLAGQVRKLQKPSASAWLINMLAGHRAKELQGALALGESLRTAQDSLDRKQLKELGTKRQQLIAAMVKDGRSLGEELGQKISPSVAIAVEQTLRAAMADARAAAAVATGRLVRALAASGWEPVDLAGAVGGPFEIHAPYSDAAGEPENDDAAQARSELEDAESRAQQANDDAGRAGARIQQLKETRQGLVARVNELRKRIRDLELDIDAIDDEANDAARERTEADRAASETKREADRARKRFDKMR